MIYKIYIVPVEFKGEQDMPVVRGYAVRVGKAAGHIGKRPFVTPTFHIVVADPYFQRIPIFQPKLELGVFSRATRPFRMGMSFGLLFGFGISVL